MNEFDKFYGMYGELYVKQLELETQFKQDAENVLKASLEKAQQEGEASKTKIGKKLIDVAWNTCRDNMQALIDSVKKPKRGVVPAYTEDLKTLIGIYRKQPEKLVNLLTLSSLSTMLNAVFTVKDASISAVALKITDSILTEANIEKFIQSESMKDEDCLKGSKLAKVIDDGIKKRVQQSYKMKYIQQMMYVKGFQRIKWSKEQRQRLGAKIMEMALKGSSFFSIQELNLNTIKGVKETGRTNLKNSDLNCIVPSEWLARTWQKNEEILTKYAHKLIPTIIPPLDWTCPYGGGYYGQLQEFSSLIRLQHDNSNIFIRNYKKKLEAVNLSRVYNALNDMQQTPFVINKNILKVSEEIMASGGNLGGFPATEPYPQLPELTGDYTEQELKDHKKKMVAIIKRNQARQSRCLRALMALSTARKFEPYDRIYFPWNMDYRGRCYPIPTALSPQGDDITKALLLFADPAPCQNLDDWKWLAIHGANLAGHDKISFSERIKWVQDNEVNIIASADDPLGYIWWSKEAENDYPMEFLAFCFEWKRLKSYMSEHGNCLGFKSGIAIAFDGTCSGLQHFSALLRDEIGGNAVNLVPNEKVQDIYSIVAEKVNKVLTKDAVSGNEDAYKKDKKTGKIALDYNGKKLMKFGTKTLAQQWITFARMKYGQDGITRKVCKRSVMTLAYGSKKYGFKENIQEDIIKPFANAHPNDNPFVQPIQAAQYMAELIWDAVSTTVVKAVEGMKYLQDLATLICKDKHVVTWVTPNGLPVQQNYMEVKQNVFKMRISGSIKRFYNQEETGNIDARGQAQGIAPNFIHSMDACHMQRVVTASYTEGNTNFAMVHDSFGTDVAHAGRLFRIIREQFIQLYDNQDHLANFLEDVKYLIDEGAELPEHPTFGKLDIKKVADSDFCFA